MKPSNETALAVSILLLGGGLYACGQMILANAGPLTGYQRIEGLLGLAAAAAGVLVVGWWVMAVILALVSELLLAAGHPQAARCAGLLSPGFLKRLATAMVGLHALSGIPAALGGELPRGQLATTTEPTQSASALPSGAEPGGDDAPVIRPQWRPVPVPTDGPPLLRGPIRAPAPTGQTSGPAVVIVGVGDSLWSIAATHLGPFATDVEVAAAWPRWHQENREVIGDNPHLLLPGQLLRVPPTAR